MHVVAGGGLAGLVAAARIVEAGHDVRVFEPTDTVGGRARTYGTAGDPVERFPTPLGSTDIDRDGTVHEVAATHGIADRIVRSRGRTARYLDGVVHPVDAPWERLAYPGLGPRNALRRRRVERAVRTSAPDDVSARSFLADRGVDRDDEWFEPRLHAEFGDQAGDVSAAWLADRFEARTDRDRHGVVVGRFEGSFRVLVEALIETIGDGRIRRNARVVDVDAAAGDGPAPTVTVTDGSGTRQLEADGVVLATGPRELERVIGTPVGVDPLARTCALVTTTDPVTDVWRLIPDGDAPFGTLVEHTNAVPPTRYGGDHLLYLVGRGVGSRGGDDERVSDEGVRESWLAALSDRFPSFSRESVRSVRVATDPCAAVVPRSGSTRDEARGDWPLPVDLSGAGFGRIAYAGPGSEADRFGTGIGARVAAGVAAGEAALDGMPPPEPEGWSWGTNAESR